MRKRATFVAILPILLLAACGGPNTGAPASE